jgi:hypothetical protein
LHMGKFHFIPSVSDAIGCRSVHPVALGSLIPL